jgi:hypothetical protein
LTRSACLSRCFKVGSVPAFTGTAIAMAYSGNL